MVNFKSVGILAIGAGLGLGAAFATSSGAHAGETLRLRSTGTLRLQDRSEDLLKREGKIRQFVVQFVSSITEADKSALIAQGLEISRYLPDDALIVMGTENAASLAKLASPRVRAVAPFEAEWKINPELLAAQGTQHLLVGVLAGASTQDTARSLARLPGVQVLNMSDRDLAISAPASRLADVARIEAIEWIERAPVIVSWILPAEPGEEVASAPSALRAPELTGHESGTKLMGFDAAWARGYKGEGQIASVADTGLDTGDLATIHRDFKDSLTQGYMMGLGTDTWADANGHGTHVSGSVVGTGAASNGAIKGGAHGAKLLFEGLWSSLLGGLMPGSDFNKLIGTVYKDGARVHSNSWGSARGFGEYDTMASRVDEYMWNHPDMLVLFAAGNSGVDNDRDGRIDDNSIGSPATAKNVLTVGASENLLAVGGNQKKLKDLRDGEKKWGVEPLASDTLSNDGNGLAAFSSRGPTRDGRLKPEIVAPGTNIVSVQSQHSQAGKLWGEFNKDYAYAGGTSMATPLTAGAATVLREYLVEGRRMAEPSAALVKATLIHTATDLFPGQFGTGPKQELPTRRPNIHEGYGRVNMDQATNLGNETVLVDEKSGVGLSEEKSMRVEVGSNGLLLATLSYTDAPAATSAAKALVNDLDLVVTGAGGQVFQKQDRINNTEMLELSGLAPGVYTVSVKGVNVPQGKNGKQPYALAVSPVRAAR